MTRIPRDQYDRPLIIPPGGGKPIAYRRPSTLGKTLDDTSSLEQWGNRLVAQGLAARPDLLAAVARCDPNDKSVLNSLCEAAKEVAGGSKASRLGTARHQLLEHHDLGQLVGVLLPGEQQVIDTWDALLAQHSIEIVGEYAEVFLVNDELQTAGTADRLVRGPWGDELRVLDIKTGGVNSPKYSGLSWAIQLACYAGSDQYIVHSGSVTEKGDGKLAYGPDPIIDRCYVDVDRSVGYVAHLPADGPARLIQVDLELGRRAAEEANRVLGLRAEAKRSALKNLGEPVEGVGIYTDTSAVEVVSMLPESPVVAIVAEPGDTRTAAQMLADAGLPPDHDMGYGPGAVQVITQPEPVTLRTQLAERIAAIRPNAEAFADLVAWWPTGVAPWKLSDPPHYESDELVLIDACVADVEAKHRLPFVETFHPAPPIREPAPAAPPVDDDRAPDEVIDNLRVIHLELAARDPQLVALADQWAVQARQSGNPVGLTTKRTRRAAEITRCMLRWAEVCGGGADFTDEWVRAALRLVIGNLQEAIDTGAYLGALTEREAQVMADIAECIGRDGLICAYTEDSVPVIHGAALEGLLTPLATAAE